MSYKTRKWKQISCTIQSGLGLALLLGGITFLIASGIYKREHASVYWERIEATVGERPTTADFRVDDFGSDLEAFREAEAQYEAAYSAEKEIQDAIMNEKNAEIFAKRMTLVTIVGSVVFVLMGIYTYRSTVVEIVIKNDKIKLIYQNKKEIDLQMQADEVSFEKIRVYAKRNLYIPVNVFQFCYKNAKGKQAVEVVYVSTKIGDEIRDLLYNQ
jgi:hypothetical protein